MIDPWRSRTVAILSLSWILVGLGSVAAPGAETGAETGATSVGAATVTDQPVQPGFVCPDPEAAGTDARESDPPGLECPILRSLIAEVDPPASPREAKQGRVASFGERKDSDPVAGPEASQEQESGIRAEGLDIDRSRIERSVATSEKHGPAVDEQPAPRDRERRPVTPIRKKPAAPKPTAEPKLDPAWAFAIENIARMLDL